MDPGYATGSHFPLFAPVFSNSGGVARVFPLLGHDGTSAGALAQTVELLTRDVEALRASVAQDADNIRSLAPIAAQTMDAVRDLLRVAELHHQRLERLEGRE